MKEIGKINLDIPKSTPGILCGYCPKIIWKDNEPNGRLFLSAGKPICVVCRLKRGKNWKQIEASVRKKQVGESERIEKEAQEKANRQAEDLAVKSKEAETDLKK